LTRSKGCNFINVCQRTDADVFLLSSPACTAPTLKSLKHAGVSQFRVSLSYCKLRTIFVGLYVSVFAPG